MNQMLRKSLLIELRFVRIYLGTISLNYVRNTIFYKFSIWNKQWDFDSNQQKKKSDFNHKFTIVIKQKGTIKLIPEFGGRGLELHHIGVKAIAYK